MTHRRDADAPWLVISVSAPARGEELLLIDALRRIGARVVRRTGERYTAHIPASKQPAMHVRDAEVAVRASTSLRYPDITWRLAGTGELEALWAHDVTRLRITERITVVPAEMETAPDPEGDVVIRLLPGVGFGTAEHATTRGCLRILQRRVEPGMRIADVGAGTGILAIAAALLGAARVLALESDALSADTAERNVALNHVADRVAVRRLEAKPGDLARPWPFDGIVANIGTETLIRLLADFRAALAPGGWLILSGAPGDEPRRLMHAARKHGLVLRDTIDEAGWWTGEFIAKQHAAGERDSAHT